MVLKRPYNIPLINLRLLSTEQRGCERRDKDRSGLIIPEVPTIYDELLPICFKSPTLCQLQIILSILVHFSCVVFSQRSVPGN